MTPYQSNRVEIGDVIQSESFVNGCYEDNKRCTGSIWVSDGGISKYVMGFVSKPKNVPPERISRDGSYWQVDYSAIDSSRIDAQYVVEHTETSGGGTDYVRNDVFSDGWLVKARRLSANGDYNSQGELIQFYQSGRFNHMVTEVNVLGKMRRTFVKDQ